MRTRRWLLIVGLTPLLVLVIAGAVYLTGPSEPSVQLRPPAGYQTIADAYYAYAVPADWKQDSAFTDSNGDFFYRGSTGWAAETLRLRDTAPVLGEAAPATLASFGQTRATPYTLSDGSRATVPGTDGGWSYTLVRPGVPDTQVLDAWLRGSRTEIWLEVHATASVAATIVSSLRG